MWGSAMQYWLGFCYSSLTELRWATFVYMLLVATQSPTHRRYSLSSSGSCAVVNSRHVAHEGERLAEIWGRIIAASSTHLLLLLHKNRGGKLYFPPCSCWQWNLAMEITPFSCLRLHYIDLRQSRVCLHTYSCR